MLSKINKQKGFTLVELAIVLVIVGLLIGGILKGQKLLLNSKVTATVAQIRGIEAAVTNFRDVYGGLPGDLKYSYLKISDCGASNEYCLNDPNGAVGTSDWDMESYQPTGANGSGVTGINEPLLFWYSLQQAGLISGITSEISGSSTPSVTAAFGKTVPASRVAGGFWAGNSVNGFEGRRTGDNTDKYTLFGTIISLVKFPAAGLDFGLGKNVTTPAIAANIDRKLDDGLPATGTIQAYGNPDSCFGGEDLTDNQYAESDTTLSCGLHIRVQK